MTPDIWLSLLTLSALEIVLGIDNIIFISILAERVPKEKRKQARNIGLLGALVSRLALLSVISWVVRLDRPLFEVFGQGFSGKSLILLGGGLFLLFKATREIHHKLEGEDHRSASPEEGAVSPLGAVVAQIMALDIVFSIDSVITAVGMTTHLWVMVAANIIALVVMVLSIQRIGGFVERHPTVKVLALSFLLMIGLVLVADGVGFHIPKGYIYFAMGFSVMVETINIYVSKKSRPVHLNAPSVPQTRKV